MAESTAKKISRVRPPRVQITYDVETNGALQQKELPFVVGVVADLSAQRTAPLPALKDRKFVEIDRDNINDVMSDAAPEISIRVENKLADDGTQLSVPLKFRSMEDFEPAKVAEQVPALKELLEMRQRLDEILAKISTNSKLDEALSGALKNETLQGLGKELGIGTDQPSTPEEGK